MPVCSTESLPPPLCYSEPVAEILNAGLAAAASTIESSEAIFAAANTDEADTIRRGGAGRE